MTRRAPGNATPWPHMTAGGPRAVRCGSWPRPSSATISTMCCSRSPSMPSTEKPDTDGAEKFDADPEAWRKQFWGNDAADKADAKPKGDGADRDGWGEPDMGVLRLRRRPPSA